MKSPDAGITMTFGAAVGTIFGVVSGMFLLISKLKSTNIEE